LKETGATRMIEKMKNIVVFVRDFEAAKHFYKEQLKLPLVQESMAIMEFFPGNGATLGVSLAMHEAAYPLVGRHTGITLQVKGIDELCRDLAKAGVEFAEPLGKTPWGKMAVVKDPDGNQFALVEG
jgi:lactoylglutathione lyase